MNNLSTKVLNTIDNKLYNPLIFNWKTTCTENCFYFEIYIKINSNLEKVGDCSFQVEKNSIYIEFMENTSLNKAYKYVGSTIHEIIFKESIKNKLNGKVTLDSLPSATLFHYNSGFRVIPEACRESIFRKTSSNKEIILKLIKLISLYDYVIKYKIKFSTEKIISKVYDIFNLLYENICSLITSFESGHLVAILQTNQIGKILEKLFPYNDINLQIRNKNIKSLNDDYLYPMFLPDVVIEEKKQKFNISENYDNSPSIQESPETVISNLEKSVELLDLKNKVISDIYSKYLDSIEIYFRECIAKEFEAGIHKIINHFGRKSPVEQIKRSRDLPY